MSSIEEKINLNKAMLPQVGSLGAHYDKWVHAPSPKSSFRLFESNILEFFSRTYWFVVPLVWVPVALALLFVSASCAQSSPFFVDSICSHLTMAERALTPPQVLWCAITGILLWTLIEYCLHRFLFHLKAESPGLITFHFMIHGLHHKFPHDHMRLVFPPVPAAIIAGLLYLPFLAFLPLQISRALLGGALLGYIGYDMIHYYVHHGTNPQLNYFAALKADHMDHHFRIPNKGDDED